MAERIYIFDTTLRDGEQTPGVSLNVNEKLQIAKLLEQMGVDVIEAGFPAASNGDFEAVKAIAQTVKASGTAALARAAKQDIDRAWEAVKYSVRPRIHIFLATSELHMEYKLRMKPQEVLERAAEMVKYAKTLCGDVEFSPEDASRTNPDFLYRVLEAVIDAGANVVNIPDTVGYSTPGEIGKLISGIRGNVPNIGRAIISVHCHDDLGMAVANSLSAVESGARQVECTVNGLGERAGNAALEEIVMALRTRADHFGYMTGISTEQIYRASNTVRYLTGISVPPNKAIVGENAFAHESGIHQHGVLAKRETYEIMTPESIGLKQNKMVLGKHSGRHAFDDRLKLLGYVHLTPEEVNKAFKGFKELADRKKHITDRDIEALVCHEAARTEEIYQLEQFQVSTGSNISSASAVKLRCSGKLLEEASIGDGPVDAVFKAIDRATGIKVELEDYFIKAITGGQDALGEVTVKLSKDGMLFIGHGVSTDIIDASAKAYINAVNNMAGRINFDSMAVEEAEKAQ